MRFSLKSLILLTLLIGICTSFILTLNTTRRSDAKSEEIERQIEQKAGNVKYFSEQIEIAAAEIGLLAGQRQRLQTIREQMAEIFSEAATAEGQVTSREGMLSVREIPLQNWGNGFHKKFRVSVPEDHRFRLKLRFVTDNKKEVSWQDHFESVDRNTAPLSASQMVVGFSFGKPDSSANLKSKPQLVVSIDSQPVFSYRFKHSESSGYSVSGLSFDQQRDFEPGKKTHDLVEFRPRPSKATVVL